MPGFGTLLFELLLEAKRSWFLISDNLWNESHSLGSLLWCGDKGNVVDPHESQVTDRQLNQQSKLSLCMM